MISEKPIAKTIKNVLKAFSLTNSLKRNTFSSDCNKPKNDFFDDLLRFPTNINSTMKNECVNDELENTDVKFQEKLYDSDSQIESNPRHGLELFFQSILNCTKEFSDEEVLDLQIQVLKFVKNIKGKRDLKLNLRRYCVASMSFSHGAKKSNVSGV